jgi:hypothetical protein
VANHEQLPFYAEGNSVKSLILTEKPKERKKLKKFPKNPKMVFEFTEKCGIVRRPARDESTFLLPFRNVSAVNTDVGSVLTGLFSRLFNTELFQYEVSIFRQTQTAFGDTGKPGVALGEPAWVL